jgi:uncharacterized protein YqiB (DUF1249 family)
VKLDVQRSHRIYEKLLRVAPDVRHILLYAKSSVSGFMDLHLDVLDRTPEYRRIVLSHYWKHPTGDMIPDPDMSIAVFFDREQAEALTYQDAHRYEVAYTKPGEPPDLEVHTRLNVFLERWLGALAEQGHVLRLHDRTTI